MPIQLPPAAHVNQVLRTHPRLDQIAKAEPIVLQLLTLAASQQGCPNRWHSYEVLKRACSQHVGFGASQPGLQSPEAYETTMNALDLLLPSDEDEEDIHLDSLPKLRDAVLLLCPSLALPGWCWEEEKAG